MLHQLGNIRHTVTKWRKRDFQGAQPQVQVLPEVALGDAVIALTTNVAIKKADAGEGGFVAFDENWYDVHHDATPDGSSVSEENEKLKAGL